MIWSDGNDTGRGEELAGHGVIRKCGPIRIVKPLFSVVIPAYNDWAALDGCLRSLAQQEKAPSFEVLVVDDGSREPAPPLIHRWTGYFFLAIVRQPHQGVASARNRGAEASRGSVLVFVDADCRLRKECLSALHSTIANSPGHDCFQLHLVGDCSTLVGRAEGLRLMTLQNHLVQPDRRIRYLNTSGFAVRRTRVRPEEEMFDPSVRRGEDTLFLARLMEQGELPLFVREAIIEHTISLSLAKCLLKDVRSGYFAAKAHREISARGLRIRVNHLERLQVLSSMWRNSGEPSIGRAGYFVLLARQSVERATSAVSKHLWRAPSASGHSTL